MSSQFGHAADGQPSQPAYTPVNWGYQTPMVLAQPKNGIGTTALVLGIIGLVLSIVLLPFTMFSLLLSIPAIIFGAIRIVKAGNGSATNRGSAVAGLVCGVIAVAVTIVMTVAFVSAWD